MPNKKTRHLITFPAFSFDKIMLYHKVRKEKGISAFECSFLLGKHDFFIRDAEDPFKPTLIDPEDSAHLAKIFLLKDYNPPVSPLDLYKLSIEEIKIDRKRTKRRITIDSDLTLPNKYIEIDTEEKQDELKTDLFLSSYAEVEFVFRELLEHGFFIRPRTALEIFDEYRAMYDFGPNFHPRYLIQNIRYFLNKKSGEPVLDSSRTDLFSRRLFLMPFDFDIDPSKGDISSIFAENGIHTFRAAGKWVAQLDYRRNDNKDNPLCVFEDRGGTCSTKHALLKRLALENGQTSVRLKQGIYTMNGKNTPAIKEVLKKYALKYLPEAHNYLRVCAYMLDFTGIGINETKFDRDILDEIEITPEQVTDFKIAYHKEYLERWISENDVPYSLDEIWRIREECIQTISNN